MTEILLRRWQEAALHRWADGGHRGVVSVVTGGGKTVFALACVKHLRPDTVLILVPTAALLEQWWEEAANFLELSLDEIHVLQGRGARARPGTVNIAVINTAAKADPSLNPECFLIVDECHRVASPEFRKALEVKAHATLGLSATPERQYDDGLQSVIVPALGPVIYEYTYRDALDDGVIVPFVLRNIVFDLEPERQLEYDKLTRSIARSISRSGIEAPETVALFLRRSRTLNMSESRVRLALKLVAANRGRRTLVFHEDIAACTVIHDVLAASQISVGIYHSEMSMRTRAETLSGYRSGKIEVLVTCRALDEGFNVPETEIGIIAASTATRRQRIQRLGRILRPASGKDGATIYTLVASNAEIGRLKDEEGLLEGVADVVWSKA